MTNEEPGLKLTVILLSAESYRRLYVSSKLVYERIYAVDFAQENVVDSDLQEVSRRWNLLKRMTNLISLIRV